MRGTVTALLIAIACGTAISARAAEPEQDAGRTIYLQYCGACHGTTAKGDGSVGSLLQTKPSDLTQLAKKNGGEFPFTHVMEVIDGRRNIRAHGEKEMPVWGEVFAERPTWEIGRRAEVLGKEMLITEYIRSIQVK